MKIVHYFKTKRRGIIIALGVSILIMAIGIAMRYRSFTAEPSNDQPGELIKMIGMKEIDPKKLSTYQSVSGVLDIQHWNTSNGVPVYFVAVPTLPMVDVEVVFDAGAAREEGTKGGVAYLTNTLLSQGAENVTADQIAERFDDVGAQYAASSARDMASVTLRSLSDPKLFLPALELLGTILSHPTFPEADVQREKQKVLTLLKKQAQNPAQVASRAFYSLLYPNQPYSHWVLGNEQSIGKLSVEDIKAFYKQFYVARNAVVVIVGNVTAAEANAIAEKITQKLALGEKPASLPIVKNLTQSTTEGISFPSSQTHILVGQPFIKQGDPDYYALYVGNHILGGNGSVTRVFNTIRTQQGLAYSVYSHFQPMRERGPFIMGCQTRNEEADKALDLLLEVLKEYLEKGPTEKELEQAKRNILGGYALHFDSNALITEQVASLGFYGLPLNRFDHFKEAVEKLTIQDIQKAFQKHLSSKDLVIVRVGKSEKSG